MKKFLILGVIIPVLAAACLADQPMTPGAFVDIGLARASSMGGAFVAVADDASSVFYNPAGIVTSLFKEFSFMYTKFKGIVPYNYGSVIVPLNENRGVGLGVIVSGDALYDEKTFIVGYAENFDWILGKLIGLNGLRVGANFKLQFAGYGNNTTDGSIDRVTGSAGGFGFDLGMLYAISPEVQFGAMVRDAVSAIWWGSRYDSTDHSYVQGVGLTSELGLRYKIKEFMLSASVSDFDKLKVGFEKNLWTVVDVRAGYTQTLDLESYKGYSLGLGIGHFEFGQRKEFSMNVDCAYLFERLDNTLKFQTSFKFH